jgi:hypothetical protein
LATCALAQGSTRPGMKPNGAVAPLGPRVDRADRSSRPDPLRAGPTRGIGGATGPCDPQGEVSCRAKTRAYITTVPEQVMSMANLLLYLPRLIKQGCCEEVLFAVRNYDPSRYGFVKTLSHLALLPHEVAIAALRPLKRTRWPQFRAAFRILQGPPYTAPAD